MTKAVGSGPNFLARFEIDADHSEKFARDNDFLTIDSPKFLINGAE